MLIKDMFAKPIDRDIKGVIKVGQADDENIRQELEEYVVTRELQKHFAEFFSSYKRGLKGKTDKMGVWISGFFGSGKSHFLKILSYLIENKEVDGKKALDYFIDDNKIIDPMVLADMTLAASVPTDVILFNIDSKSEMAGKHDKDAIVSVFLKVFNEMQGFCGSIPALADLERELTQRGLYESFKGKFQEDFGSPWLESRNKFDFIQDTVVDVLVDIGFMKEESARNWCEKAIEPYQISIENFAKLVKAYLDKKTPDHRLVFLVDEIGQYIGDDSKLMLNLQTVTEDLGIACQGRVWIIVTSQQDIDSITEIRGNDFSKIQGRFDTRLSLSSANVDEVIKKRVLEKNQTADQTLRLLYEQKSTVIKNLIVFNDAVEKKLYADEADFSMVYPFIPYQFNLLAAVLTSIRTHGASGKHLSEGERSMLALFKESAMKLMAADQGALVPFNVFYDALHQFLDHSHKGVITRAWSNDYINPDREENCFNVNVLKTLFMIKYVDEIKAGLENITSLMISNIDDDRIRLKKDVEEALKVLERQMLVQKNGDEYVFLTDEEQEINREIENQNVEMADVIKSVSEIVFEEIFSEKKYTYPKHAGRYNFAFNQFVDDRPYKLNQNNDIGLRIISPAHDNSGDDATLRMMSGQGREVLVALPDKNAFLTELQAALKIEKYLRQATAKQLSKFEQIRRSKGSEMSERKGDAKLFLQEAMREAVIYVNGDRAPIAAKDVSNRINQALSRLVETTYHKLSYIESAMSEAHIRALFRSSDQQTLDLQGEDEVNKLALQDLLAFIADNTAIHSKTSMKTLINRFTRAPYGFIEEDVEWLVAKLFKQGDLAFSLNGGPVTLFNKSTDDIIRYITKREYLEKLLIEKRKQAGLEEKKAVREVMKELFGFSGINDDDDSIMQSFQSYGNGLLNELDKYEVYYQNAAYPGKEVLADGKKLLRASVLAQAPGEFFSKVRQDREDFLDFAEDYEPLKIFFAGDQKKIFDDALKLMRIYDESKNFIADQEVARAVKAIKEILKKKQPYFDIPKLPKLLEEFKESYGKVLDDMTPPVKEAVEGARSRVLEELNTKTYKEEYKDRYLRLFEELREKIKSCNNVANLQNIKIEADTLKIRLLNEMNGLDRKAAEKPEDYVPGQKDDPPAPVKRKKTLSIKSLSMANSWQIETEEDLESYLNHLKSQILKELDDQTSLSIEL